MEKTQCIYKIINIVNQKIYIGSAIDFKRRKRIHFDLLRKNKHHSIKLQNSFNKHGEDKFTIEIIEKVNDSSKLIECEQYWLDKLKPVLNMTLIAGLNSHLGMKRSKETKDKIRKALTGKKQSPEHVKANRRSHIGLKQSKETKNKRIESIKNSEIAKQSYQSKLRKEKTKKTRIKNGGYVVTEKMKEKISKTLKNKENYHGGNNYHVEKYDLEGNLLETYPSMTVAENNNSITNGYLSLRLKQNKNKIKGFVWKLKEK